MPTFELMMEAQHVFDGRFPDIPVPESLKSLPASLGDTDPVFMTLPIGRVDAESRNGRKYPRAAVEAMVEAINKNKPGGQKGHLRETDRPYTFDVPPIMWLAAELDSTGTAWAKAYVMPQAKDVRDYVKARKAAHAAVGTSLYGMGEMDDDGTVTKLEIETIDLVHPQRVGVPMASSVPVITAESFDEPRASDQANPAQPNTEQKEPNMAQEVALDPTKQKLAPAPATLSETEMERKHTEAVRVLNETITKQSNELADYKQIMAELKNPADPVTAVRVLQESLRQVQVENVELLQETVKAKVDEAVKLETVRPIVLTMVKKMKPKTRHEVTRFVTETVDSDEIQALLEAQRVAEAGDPHKRPAQTDQKKTDAKADDFYVPAY
jgi:hypothetical protein